MRNTAMAPMVQPQKILVIAFKYLGDAVMITPALRAIREHYPDCALHVLVPEEFAPLYQHIPWLNRVWGMPRVRGRARIRQSWPFIRALRRERFDRSVDFGGNDRGGILSLLSGARQRLGPVSPGNFFGHRYCYTQHIQWAGLAQDWVQRNLQILSVWGVPRPSSLAMEINADPALEEFATRLLPQKKIICYLTTGRIKKDWPIPHWATLWKIAAAAGHELVFLSGRDQREKSQAQSFKSMIPDTLFLPELPDVACLLAVLKRASVFVAGDTGPLHCAAGLGVPVVGLFGTVNTLCYAAPSFAPNQKLVGSPCTCSPAVHICNSAQPCMAGISPDTVLHRLEQILAVPKPALSR